MMETALEKDAIGLHDEKVQVQLQQLQSATAHKVLQVNTYKHHGTEANIQIRRETATQAVAPVAFDYT